MRKHVMLQWTVFFFSGTNQLQEAFGANGCQAFRTGGIGQDCGELLKSAGPTWSIVDFDSSS